MGFVEYLNAMITVDQRGFIFKWKYNRYKRLGYLRNCTHYFRMQTLKIFLQKTTNCWSKFANSEPVYYVSVDTSRHLVGIFHLENTK